MPQEDFYATFAGPIDNQAAHRFFAHVSAVINGGAKKAHLLIQSAGGYVGDGIAIHTYLKNLPIEIITYNAGNVSSIAVIVFLAGSVRKASSNATFMIHKSSYTPSAPVTAEAIRISADALEMNDRNTEKILRSYLTMPEDKWRLHERGDLHLDSNFSKECGLIHEISDFKLPQGTRIFNI